MAVDEIVKSNPSSKDVTVDKMDSDNAVYRQLLGHPLPCNQDVYILRLYTLGIPLMDDSAWS